MIDGAQDFSILSAQECRRLLGSTTVGRIVYTSNALPAVAPVNYVMDGDDIIIRTAPGSKLEAAMRNTIVGFQIDQIDLATHTGWSVLAIGHATHVTDPASIGRLDTLGLVTWMPDARNHYVRIACHQLTGRVLDGQRPPPPW